MRTALLVLLILCIYSPVRCVIRTGNPEKIDNKGNPAVGMIRFSIDVFDKQKRIVEEERNRVEKRLKSFLKKNFDFNDKFYFEEYSDVITYSYIEDPEVTIDPQFESRAYKKLKELSEENKLNAIVFGHFQEEEDLIVVFRYYLAGEQIPKDQRIVSTKPINVKINEKFKDELQKQVDALATELEDNLKARFVKTQKDENQSKESSKKNKAKYQSPTEETTENVEEMLTAYEVYQMIADNSFYCEIIMGSPFHGEGLKGINPLPKNGIFKDGRSIKLFTEPGKDLIRTESQLKVGNGEKIVLRWPSVKYITLKPTSFEEAQAYIDYLNKIEEDKTKKWRIPTIMELFSIIKGDTRNHFHTFFNFPNRNQDLIFWTSTQVKKEGTVLEYSKNEIAYFVIRSLYQKKIDIYSLSFSVYNIDGKENRKAFILPVFSEREYRYKLAANEIPGFDVTETTRHKLAENEIPGFDVTETTRNASGYNTGKSSSAEPKTSSKDIPKSSGPIQPAAKATYESRGVKPVEVNKNGQRVILYENSYALLIGVSKYEHWQSLNSVPKEMSLLETSLKKHGFIIKTSLNPTSDELSNTIKDFIDQYGFKQNNRLLIFFSGHGYTRKDGTKGYIVPSDAADPRVDEMDFVRKAIDMEQIQTWAKKIEAKHALFVFDSCFSGTIFKTRDFPTPAYISYLTAKPVRQFITAGDAGELLPAKSYFIPCFIRGIEGEADAYRDGYITATELGLFLQREIKNYNVGQTPQFGKIRDPELDQGDFVFIIDASQPPSPQPLP